MSEAGIGLHVIGIGQPLRGDDAIGLELVSTLESAGIEGVSCALWEDADALTLAHDLAELSGPALVVDCADMGLAPGAWRLFDESNLRGTHSFSTHGMGMAEAIRLARAAGYDEPLWCFGVQPADLDLRQGLSEPLRVCFEVLVRDLRTEVRELLTKVREG